MTASVWTPGDVGDISQVNADNTYKAQQFTNTTQGQTLFTLTNFAYAVGTTSLEVNINGVKQFPGIDFTETSSNSFTILQGVDAGDIVAAFGLIGSPAAASAAVSAANSQAAAAAAVISETNAKTSESNSKTSENNAAISAQNAANAANAVAGSQIQADWSQTNNTFKDYIKNKPSGLSSTNVSNINESTIAAGYGSTGVLNVNYRGATTAITQVRFYSGMADNALAAIVGSNITAGGNVLGTAVNITGVAAIANGGTGATTSAGALTNLGAVPSAGGNMTGNLCLANNTAALQFKKTDNTAVNFAYLGSDNNLNMVIPTAINFARWVSASNSPIWTLDNLGNSTQVGKATAGSLQVNGQSVFAEGSASSPGIGWQTDTGSDTGFYHYSDGYFAMTNNGTTTNLYNPTSTNCIVQLNVDTSIKGTNYTTAAFQNNNGLSILLQGSGPNPFKTIRLLGGALQIINSAYTAQLWNLDDAGNMSCTGSSYAVNFYASSDAKLKQNWREVPYYVEGLAAINTYGLFDWIDGSGTGAGATAQELEKLIPELVIEVNGVKKVDYNGLTSYGVIALAKRTIEQEARIKDLEDKLSKITEKLCL